MYNNAVHIGYSNSYIGYFQVVQSKLNPPLYLDKQEACGFILFCKSRQNRFYLGSFENGL